MKNHFELNPAIDKKIEGKLSNNKIIGMKEENEELVKDQAEESTNETTSQETQDTDNTVENTEAGEGLDEIEQLKIDVAEAKDKYLRLYSEFENFRRRTSKEKIELITTANREVVEAILPVLDDFERSIKAQGEEESEGVKLIFNKLKNILEGKGLKRMEISTGDDFNDEFHEAITQIPAPSEDLAGKIVDVVEPGYYLGEKVIRFAKVVTGAKN